MGYPRKSYPHRCSPPCAKRARPRACARVYIIYRSPVGRSRGVSAPLWGRGRTVVTPCPAPACAGWGRAKAKVDAPSRRAPHFPCLRPRTCPLMSESLCAKAECTRQSPLLPVRSSRDSLSTAVPLPADGRSAERKGGSAQGNPRSCPCVLPASACLRPRPCPLMGEAPSAKAEVHKAIPAPARAFFPRRLVYGRALCPLMGEVPSAGWGRAKAKADAPSRSNPPPPAYGRAPVCLPPRPRRLNGHPTSAGGRENDRMAHRRTTTPTHRTQRGNDTCTIRVP